MTNHINNPRRDQMDNFINLSAGRGTHTKTVKRKQSLQSLHRT